MLQNNPSLLPNFKQKSLTCLFLTNLTDSVVTTHFLHCAVYGQPSLLLLSNWYQMILQHSIGRGQVLWTSSDNSFNIISKIQRLSLTSVLSRKHDCIFGGVRMIYQNVLMKIRQKFMNHKIMTSEESHHCAPIVLQQAIPR